MSGICENHRGTLVLRPEHEHPPEGEHHRYEHECPPKGEHPPKEGDYCPPPEAYIACEGKTVGDVAQFEDHHGKVMNGTCEDDEGKLVLRPNRPKNEQL